ncbi:MAG: hypothetical protein DWQ07_19910 [Chloroflexi bacterium]|nr:MAG: hypothetical protein DWQ07_19910 [Chloroflexota bacterium]MBL1194349.1 site-specific integrase [Chloroflexota bacterium]NOH11639.1 site-specific integrase [Chloroflexota bacterium]
MIERGNYFAVLAYIEYCKNAMQCSPKTAKRKWGHLRHLLEWADDTDFANILARMDSFPSYLLSSRNDGKKKRLSTATMKRSCGEARRFFYWARTQHPLKYRKIIPTWIETIRPARANSIDSEIQQREYYSLEEVRMLCSFNPISLTDKRDRAATALTFLSGIRVGALVSLPIKCVDIENLEVHQLPAEGVQTKNTKAAITFLLPIDDLLMVVREWHEVVIGELGPSGLWYPNLSTDGMEWSTRDNIGDVDSRRQSFARGLKRFCSRIGISYKSPHKLRNGHAIYGIKHVKTIKEFKAFSQNMMHESMEITDRLYGQLAHDDVRKAIMELTNNNEGISTEDQKLYSEFVAFRNWMEKSNSSNKPNDTLQ